MAKQWDRVIKLLMQANPQDLVSWIFTDAVYQGELNLELQRKAPIFADLLYTIKLRRKKVVLHVEFQRQRHKRMDKRVWEYNCLASIHTGLPVYSVVIYLVEDKSIVDPPYQMKLPKGFTIHKFLFQNIKLWEISPEVLKQQKLPGLLPLLPLTKGGKRREVVEEMIQSLQQTDKTDLLPLGYTFAAFVFEEGDDQQWLKERFEKMKDILEESWAYREMVQEAKARALEQGKQQGLEQGKKENMKQVVVRFVEIHFPDLTLLAKKQMAQATASQQLQEMLDKLFIAQTDDEAKAILIGK